MFYWLEKLWHKHLSGSQIAWSNEKVVDGKIVITDYNQTYVDVLRLKLPEEFQTHINSEIVKTHITRLNLAREEPYLNVVHGSIGKDNQINVKLDWNDSFINSLKAQGFEGDDEDDLIRAYLAVVSSNAAAEMIKDEAIAANKPLPTQDDLEHMISVMDPDIRKMFEKAMAKK